MVVQYRLFSHNLSFLFVSTKFSIVCLFTVTEDVYLGATKNSNGEWVWSDGSPVFVALSDKTQSLSINSSALAYENK